MNARAVFHLISFLLIFLAGAIASCSIVSVVSGDPSRVVRALLYSGAITGVVGMAGWYFTRGPMHLSRRDGFGVVTFGWLIVALFGALPFVLTGEVSSPLTALFETVSGFTTTGASALEDVESLSRGLLFWRSMTQWLGGMGVLILCVAILPFLGIGGMQIYRAEMPGPTKDRLAPRIATTAKLLWGVYVLLSVFEAVLLKTCGLSWFDAVCHTFTTMSTGGFSTHNGSVAAFRGMEGVNAARVESVIVIFMLLAGVNFSLHYRALRGKIFVYAYNKEFLIYITFWLGLCAALTADTWLNVYDNIGTSFRAATFQATSLLTGTGFCTEDFNVWTPRSKLLIAFAMFAGGCAGSTTGGTKIIRIYVILKQTIREVRLFMLPHAVVQVRMGKEAISQTVVSNITAFILIFIMLFGLGTIAMTFFTPDLETASSSVIATLCNVGPGFGDVGAAHNYADIPTGGKFVLIGLMLLGRLELYTVLVLLMPGFWRK